MKQDLHFRQEVNVTKLFLDSQDLNFQKPRLVNHGTSQGSHRNQQLICSWFCVVCQSGFSFRVKVP